MNQISWIHELKKPHVTTVYVHTAQGDICWHLHTWEGRHIEGRLEAVNLPESERFWTCTIQTEKYIYRSERNAKTPLEALKQAKEDYRRYS